jgi:hypothetical protein
MAATVPAVPGARGKYPLPQPVAMTLIRDLFRDHLTQVVDQTILILTRVSTGNPLIIEQTF